MITDQQRAELKAKIDQLVSAYSHLCFVATLAPDSQEPSREKSMVLDFAFRSRNLSVDLIEWIDKEL